MQLVKYWCISVTLCKKKNLELDDHVHPDDTLIKVSGAIVKLLIFVKCV